MMGTNMLQQADPAVVAQLDQISVALIVIAVATALVGLFVLGVLFIAFRLMRSATKLMNQVQGRIDEFAPRAGPLIDKATLVADDARTLSDNVRRRVTELMDTVAKLNSSVREATEATELRVREFVAVLDVVKAEAEELLMDTAATARGIHTTAAALRSDRAPVPTPGRALTDRTGVPVPPSRGVVPTEPVPAASRSGDGSEGRRD